LRFAGREPPGKLGAAHHELPEGADPPRLQAGIGQPADADRHVHSTRSQVDRPVAQRQLHPASGMARAEGGDHRHHRRLP
jgi:hypothetical protein